MSDHIDALSPRLDGLMTRSLNDPAVREQVRDRLHAIPGVQRAVIDREQGEVWLIREPEADPIRIEDDAREILLDQHHEALALSTVVFGPDEAPVRRRVKFLGVKTRLAPEGRISVTASLGWGANVHSGEVTGESAAAIQLRTAAAATLEAIDSVLGREARIRLIGVKQVRAFDVEMLVVALKQESDGRSCVGAVRVLDDPLDAAACAVLNALNRTLGNYLTTPD